MPDEKKNAEALDRIARDCAALPRRDVRTAEDIIGYDALGLPGHQMPDGITRDQSTPHDPTFEKAVDAAERVMARDRDALKELAK
ncbi:MAG: hypothetical protein KDE22_04425 [Rhodobacterales bacterium]|nr:hypothetical protein [Rhodobacterales bacterium]